MALVLLAASINRADRRDRREFAGSPRARGALPDRIGLSARQRRQHLPDRHGYRGPHPSRGLARPSSAFNALGITSDGAHAYAMVSAGSGTSTVYEFTTADATIAQFSRARRCRAPITSLWARSTRLSGVFYLGTGTRGRARYLRFRHQHRQLRSPGRVAQVAIGRAAGSGGDMVFDASGHLYIVSGTAPGSSRPADSDGRGRRATEPVRWLTDVATSSLNGVTFDGNSYLYIFKLGARCPSSTRIPARSGLDRLDRHSRPRRRQHRRSSRLPVQQSTSATGAGSLAGRYAATPINSGSR